MAEKPKTITLIFICLFIGMLPLSPALAGDFSIIINEICWMGSDKKTSDEWIELYNNAPSVVSINNWLLKIDGAEIKLKGEIPSQGYYLISRNKNIGADLIFTKALKNTGSKISLWDDNKNLIEEMDWSKGWPAGDNKTKQTMEKIASPLSGENKNNWQTSAIAGGTLKTKNSLGVIAANKSPDNDFDNNLSYEESFAIKENNPSNSNYPGHSSVFLAGFLSLFSGAIIFFLKKYLKEQT
ncbi:MAG: lamin tail domain-containing protein [Candidatus Paceibacterota bacterium]